MFGRYNNLSLENFKFLASQDPMLANMLDRQLVSNYEEFVESLHKDIDEIIILIEDNRELVQNSEDEITIAIVRHLKHIGYTATHETKSGGHVDVMVTKKEYTWFGEAKIYKGNSNLWQGILQLATRYSVSKPNKNTGGLLIYTYNENVKDLMNEWKIYMSNQTEFSNYSQTDCPKNPLAFFSIFDHSVTGLPYTVRHIPACFYFEPKDKSGQSTKTNRSKSTKVKKGN